MHSPTYTGRQSGSLAEPKPDPELWNNTDPFSGDDAENSTRDQIASRDVEAGTSSDTVVETDGHDHNPPNALNHSRSTARTNRENLQLQSIRATGPGGIFHPTNVRVHIKWQDHDNDNDNDNDDQSRNNGNDDEINNGGISRNLSVATKNPARDSDLALRWHSRDSRKRRNSSAVSSSMLASTESQTRYSARGRAMSEFRSVGKGIWKMFTTFPYWDLAFWSGWSYSVGSVLFVIDGAFAWAPIAFPDTEFPGEIEYAGGFLFFFGALLYELGAVTAYFEAVNDETFQGSAMREFLDGYAEDHKKMVDEKLHAFFGHVRHPRSRRGGRNRRTAEVEAKDPDPEAGWGTKESPDRWVSRSPSEKKRTPRRDGLNADGHSDVREGESSGYQTWRWWPSWQRLKTYHIYDIGYLACSVQLLGATLYAITGVVSLPGILDSLSQWEENAAYWIPNIVASACFLAASMLFMLEAQEKWYKAELTVLGWWIGFWATVGSVGFLLNACFGIVSYTNSGAAYQSPLASLWGSGAYLFSALLQWYEGVNKNPVAEIFNEPGKMKTFQMHGI